MKFQRKGWVLAHVSMYVSNESPTLVDVYFDDVTMTYTPGNILQYNEYYPFGLQTANSWTRENTTGNNFLYNGGTELNTTTQVYDLHYRNYDPVLGRMNQVDPVASKYGSVTPYNYAFNAPTNMNDPFGDDPKDPKNTPKPTGAGGNANGGCSWCSPQDTGNGMGGFGNGSQLFSRSNAFFNPGWQPGSGSLSARAFASQDARYNAGAIARGDFRGLPDGTYTIDGNGGFTYAPIAYTYWLSSSLTMAYTQVGREVMGTLRNVVVNGIRDIPVVVNGNLTQGDDLGKGVNFSLFAMYAWFQLGGGKDLTINARSLDFSNTSQKELGLDKLKVGQTLDPVNLFNTGINPKSLAFGRLSMTKVSDTEFSIAPNPFDFDYQSNASWQRNLGTVIAGMVNYNIGVSGVSPLIPIIYGGPYNVIFNGTVTIPK